MAEASEGQALQQAQALRARAAERHGRRAQAAISAPKWSPEAFREAFGGFWWCAEVKREVSHLPDSYSEGLSALSELLRSQHNSQTAMFHLARF